MNKKLNTVLFLIGAMLANIVLVIVVFLALVIPYSAFLAPLVPTWIGSFIVVGCMVAGFLVSFVVYNSLMKLLSQKVQLEDYFEPIIKPPKKKPPTNP